MIKDNFFSGLKTILPIVLFLIILGWVFGTLFHWIECVELIFPEKFLEAIGLPDVVIKLLGLLLICTIVWVIGVISKQPKMSTKFKSWLEPIIYRVPLLSHLFKITNQVESTLRNTDSFKKVVLVKTFDDGYEVGFITGENPQGFCESLNESNLVSVVLPFSPLTSYRVLIVKPENIVETNVPVSTAISYIISMGAAGATSEIMDQSHSYLEWDFFVVFFVYKIIYDFHTIFILNMIYKWYKELKRRKIISLLDCWWYCQRYFSLWF